MPQRKILLIMFFIKIKSVLNDTLGLRCIKAHLSNKSNNRSQRLRSGYIALAALNLLLAGFSAADSTALDTYISEHLPEASALTCQEPILYPSSVIHSCSFTSQRWPAGAKTIEGEAWEHNITIAIPKNKEHIPDTALYFSDDGKNNRSGSDLRQFIMLTQLKNAPMLQRSHLHSNIMIDLIVKETNAIFIYQQQVPNQPYTFLDALETPLTESELLAESLVRATASNTTEPADTVLLPMAEANVAGIYKASDFINANLITDPIKHVVVGGGSKRAWGIWLAAAFDQGEDKRARQLISAIVPISMIQNFSKTLNAIQNSYCGFPKPLSPFTSRHIFQEYLSSDDNRYSKLFNVIDPYYYLKQRFNNIHTMVIQSSSDHYFIPDATHYYYPELKGSKNMMVLPNIAHSNSIPTMNYMDGILTNLTAIIHGFSLPTYQEEYDHHSSTLTLHSGHKPDHVYIWSANNPNARDFRLKSATFTREEIQPIVAIDDSFTYQWQPGKQKGWTAFFMEMSYKAPNNKSFLFSTQVYITPDSYPACIISQEHLEDVNSPI